MSRNNRGMDNTFQMSRLNSIEVSSNDRFRMNSTIQKSSGKKKEKAKKKYRTKREKGPDFETPDPSEHQEPP